MKKTFLIIACLFLIILFVADSSWAFQSTFDSDNESWSATGDYQSFYWSNTQGNPPGSIQAKDQGFSIFWYFVAPSSWSGDWTSLIGNRLEYDLIILEGPDGNADQPDVTIFGAGTYMSWQSNIRPTSQEWTYFAVDLLPTNFGVSEETFNTIMADVTGLHIRGEMIAGASVYDVEALDNVRIVPIPGTIFLISSGLLGIIGLRRRRKGD